MVSHLSNQVINSSATCRPGDVPWKLVRFPVDRRCPPWSFRQLLGVPGTTRGETCLLTSPIGKV